MIVNELIKNVTKTSKIRLHLQGKYINQVEFDIEVFILLITKRKILENLNYNPNVLLSKSSD